jgi:tripartite-type tricarboxylate transporter receptor subunit TctC
MAEFVSGYEASGWLGIGAPKGTPADIVMTLNKAVDAFETDPASKARLVSLGVEPMVMSPAEFGEFIAAETHKWASVVEFAGVKAD